MARRQSHDVIAPILEEGVGGVEKCTRLSLYKRCEGRIKVGFGTDVDNMQKPPASARQHLQLSHAGLSVRIVRICQQANYRDIGNDLTQRLQTLRQQLSADRGHARNVAAGAVEAGDKTNLDRIGTRLKD